MTPYRLLKYAIRPALAELEPHGIAPSEAAERFLLAIALQESALRHRRQVVANGLENGPAASFWQFERGGGCVGALRHPLAAPRMRAILEEFNVEPTPLALWEAMRYNDIVAAAAARLLVYTLPGKLPEDPADGWEQYLDAWRPGEPHPSTWAINWNLADQVVKAGRDK